jgi:hypothetical protein
MPFTRQGEKRPPNAGRRAGTPNKATKELKDLLRDLVKKPEIQEAIEKQILAGDRGAAQLFIAAMNQVLGKPREAVEVSTSPGWPSSSSSASSKRRRGGAARLAVAATAPLAPHRSSG